MSMPVKTYRCIKGLVLGFSLTAVLSFLFVSESASAAKKAASEGRRDRNAARATSDSVPTERRRTDELPSPNERATVFDASTAQSPRPKVTAESGLICFYGKERDERTGRDRCLSPEELNPPRIVLANTLALAERAGLLRQDVHHDASALSETAAVSSGTSSDDAGMTEGDTSSETNRTARVVRVSFENGVVGRAQRALEAKADDMEACVTEKGGLKQPSARLKIMFLVRSRGVAEGLIIASARNIPPAIVSCIRKLIENQPIGTPSNEPVGVTALIELRSEDQDE